ncbi:MAG: [FeFe] hydrogenase H-cluster radical SAM maturase HydE [Alphaproteobacteria bacterium]
MKVSLEELTQKSGDLSAADVAAHLDITDQAQIDEVQQLAERVLLDECGNKVYFRGLVEASNICKSDCHYCGIRKFNKVPERYQLEAETVVELAKRAKALNYASFVIQAGERQDEGFIEYIEGIVRSIKEQTRCEVLPEGLGITLSVGQHTKETYQRFYDAGAHRYLLRIETTNPDLFAKLHPEAQTLQSRMACLGYLRDIGYQVGTGVMIGLPQQTTLDLANDILFFRDFDIDMIGMGPFIPDPAAYDVGGMEWAADECPSAEERVLQTLLMTAMTRIILRDVNIAATTALQALEPHARERALRFGANVMMPLLTPQDVRKNYNLYPKKSLRDEASDDFHRELEERIHAQGRVVGYGVWGDSPHALKEARL